MDVTQRIVASASKSFREGNYQEALNLYQKAATLYDSAFFSANIALCEQRIKGEPEHKQVLAGSPAESRQLAETQSLLEHYYRRCQELEYQLLETATP
ncbi:hypothetical protein LG409_06165 [Halomonas sp. NyZ770]|uniref:Tetratricopeptide repeat protein n=1 Tax=Vreelandella hamiltonii TaxID=502829 RepID=A0A8H9IBV9_9GAMM|nr:MULTISPECIES: hypothetical protein [Halomonas]ATH79327.1 hypothetical protein CLM76_17750 [Halomonas hydrothermalis]UDM08489.1 hypothetical protein LG409_06165 [Halomonas sp. NyZ770]GGW41999.1 hypothetical protein GCM10007157_35430 [Halomonas hamiltonii]